MEKLDLRKQYRYLYFPSAKTVEVVDVPQFKFVMIDGQIEPGMAPETSPVFQEAFKALYGMSFTLKFMSKLRKLNPIDYTVMALEGLWWSESGIFDFQRKGDWRWTLMMMQPDHIDEAMFQKALAQLRRKADSPGLSRLRFESYHEGLSMQIMHMGPYADEPHTIEILHSYARDNGYRLRGKHHEIYLGDPRRAKPENLKTVIRQPIEKST